MKLILIAATGTKGEIGYENRLPWKCFNDMRYFKKTTVGETHGCVMGRKTWESLPPNKLPGRVCIVLSSIPIDDERCVVVSSFDEAKAAARKIGLTKLFIIGGSSLFHDYYGSCDEMHITTILTPVHNADTWFRPNISPVRWRLLTQEDYDDCVIKRWVRR